MKLVIGHIFGFAVMFAVCFFALGTLMLFFPFVTAFVVWSWDPVSFGWEPTFMFARIISVFSALIAIAFTCSTSGQELAREFAEGK